MKQILKATLALNILISLSMGALASIENNAGYAFYIALMLFGSYFFPVLIFVIIYHSLLGRRNIHQSNLISILLKGLILFFISFVGLFIWALLEFTFTDDLQNFSWALIIQDYTVEYFGYLPIAFLLSYLITLSYQFFSPKKIISNPNK